MERLLDSLSAAFIADDTLSSHGMDYRQIDQDAINVKATEAKRAITISLDVLAEFIDVAVANKVGPDPDGLFRLLQFAREVSVLVDYLSQFHVGVSKRKVEIGNGDGNICILKSPGDAHEQFRLIEKAVVCSCGGREIRHNKYSLIQYLIKTAGDVSRRQMRATAPHPSEKDDPGTALWMLDQADRLIRDTLAHDPQGASPK